MNDKIEEFDYNAQQAFIQFHMTPSEFDEQDFYRLNEVLSARPEEDRPPIDPGEFWSQFMK